MTPENRTALVTGGSRGIGKAIATALGSAGWNVVVNYASSQAAAQETVEQINGRGGRAHGIRADIGSSLDRQLLITETVEHFGRLDLLVNNAGIAPDQRMDILEATEASFDRLINVNLKGPYFLSQLAANAMKSNPVGADGRAGNVVTISSISAYTASVNRGDYCVAKAGLAMMTKLFAARLAELNIGVFEIRPGIIATDMTAGVKEKYDSLIANGLTPIRRWGQPTDVAKAVLAIADGLLPFSTGQVIDVDGGFHLRTL
jgi:NAD(P)-dependent dehydrogenase (short-subunit alcohol dehydrogenase family)